MCWRGEDGVAGVDGYTEGMDGLLGGESVPSIQVDIDPYKHLIREVLYSNFRVSYIGGQERSGKSLMAEILVNHMNAYKKRSAVVVVRNESHVNNFECNCISMTKVALHNKTVFEEYDRVFLHLDAELTEDEAQILADRFENTQYLTVVV